MTGEPGDPIRARIRTEIGIERAVLLHDDHDVADPVDGVRSPIRQPLPRRRAPVASRRGQLRRAKRRRGESYRLREVVVVEPDRQSVMDVDLFRVDGDDHRCRSETRRARLVRRGPLRYEHVTVRVFRRAPASFGEIQPNRVPVTDHQPVRDCRTRTACGCHDGEASRREKACAIAEIDPGYRVAASGDEQRGAVSAAREREGPDREQHGWRDPRHVVPYTARHGGE